MLGESTVRTYSAPSARYDSLQGSVEVYIRTPDARIYYAERGLTASYWDWWREPHGYGRTSAAPSVTSVTSDYTYLFVRGTPYDQIWFNTRYRDNDWSGWQVLPSGTTIDAPAATANATGNLGLFVRGTGDIVYSWNGSWNAVTGITTDAAPGASYTALFGLCVFARRSSDGRVYHNCGG